MECPNCTVENPDTRKFCRECGARLLSVCPQCGTENLAADHFCGECGKPLEEARDIPKAGPVTGAERKQVTALFSDLSGYTAMTEKLDPEDVKEITSRIFNEVRNVIGKYDGFIERFAGDGVLALFGVPRAHEDDPIRAVRAAREIHEIVEALSPEHELKIGRPLAMHSGINTGLTVTADVDPEKGTHGVTGDAINVAARLSDLAEAREIFVGPETYRRAGGYFTFETLEPAKVKGKAEPIPIFRVLAVKEEPTTVHRQSGLRANLIGRKAELFQLQEAVERLKEGKGSIIAICGDAGTGKSRLLEEFKASLDLGKIRWREGHSYPYSQYIPYFPIMDLLNRAWRIEEADPPEKIREKIESGVERLLGTRKEVAPYVGTLYSLSYPEIEEVSPEFWKSHLFDGIKALVAALTQFAPTIFCFEDIHWSDPSTLDLLRFLASDPKYGALFICVHRLPFSLFSTHQLHTLGNLYEEIRLRDLSPSDTLDMVESLLRTDGLPPDLRKFMQKRVEGNPFYVEEAINSLVETGTLTLDKGSWKLTRPISEADIPQTVQGVISARLDRLEKEMKRILQEASVIGRAFLHEILKRITNIQETLDRSLHSLEMLDLVRVRSVQPDLEYIFKHALTQEVAYNGLLKKDRQELHERIGLVMEKLFPDRITEFYETLASHFKQGRSVLKAVDYLMKSGQKSLRRYALEEAHQYYEEAFALLADKPEKTGDEKATLIDILVERALVFYYQADYGGMDDLLSPHEDLATSLDDKRRRGMFLAWLGWARWGKERYREARQYVGEALKIGEEIKDHSVIGYACTWLAFICMTLGRLEEALVFGQRAQEVYRLIPSDQYLYFKSLGAIAHIHYYKGDSRPALAAGEALVEFGRRHGNIRSLAFGYNYIGCSHLLDGDSSTALKWFEREAREAQDPMYYHAGLSLAGVAYAESGRFQEAGSALEKAVKFFRERRWEWFGTAAKIFLSMVWIAQGRMSQGLELLEQCRRTCLENERRYFYAVSEYCLGKLYLQIAQGEGDLTLSTAVRNIGFLAKNVPFAARKSEDHFNKVIEVAGEIGAKGIFARAYLDLGLLHRAKKRREKARECISKAIEYFELCEAETFLKQAREELESLE
jgi:class 3 adenylate cyclase/tetratricopeptide (TPR) repeat protein